MNIRKKDINKSASARATKDILNKMSSSQIIEAIDGLFGNRKKVEPELLAVNRQLLEKYFAKLSNSIDAIQTILEKYLQENLPEQINSYLTTCTFLDELSDSDEIKSYIEDHPHKWIDCLYYGKLIMMKIVLQDVSEKSNNSLEENNFEKFLAWESEIKHLFPSQGDDTQFNFYNVKDILNEIFPHYYILYRYTMNILTLVEKPSYNWKKCLNDKLTKKTKNLGGNEIMAINTIKPELESLITDAYKRALGLTDVGLDWKRFVSKIYTIDKDQLQTLYKNSREVIQDKNNTYNSIGRSLFGESLDIFMTELDNADNEPFTISNNSEGNITSEPSSSTQEQSTTQDTLENSQTENSQTENNIPILNKNERRRKALERRKRD